MTRKGFRLKNIYMKSESETLFVQNFSKLPEIVLIFPITRDLEGNPEKWKSVLNFVEKSEINTLLVVDKTVSGSATEYFMSHFKLLERRLIILPRSINDTLFDTVGEIVLDSNMWVIQLHDDDNWSGLLTLPQLVESETVYFSKFYLNSKAKGLVEMHDYSMPNRIVFSLVPSSIWNRFSKFVQDQGYHVAGSFDFTLNLMAQLVCKFEFNSGFEYHWKDDNWDTSRNSIEHLTGLARKDGWGGWSSPEIANVNRTIDSLASLTYINDCLTPKVLEDQIISLLKSFQPSSKKRIKLELIIPVLQAKSLGTKLLGSQMKIRDREIRKSNDRFELYTFIRNSWSTRNLADVLKMISQLESYVGFEALQTRFALWRKSITQLMERN